MIRWTLCCVMIAATWCGAQPVAAQWVRVGPLGGVRVRVPFVSVDVLPFGGGTRVRAPFTRVDTRLFATPYYGGRWYDRGVPSAYYHVPVYPHYHYYAPSYPPPVYPDPIYPPPSYAVPSYPDAYVTPHSSYPYEEAPMIDAPSSSPHVAARQGLPRGAELVGALRASASRLRQALAQRRDDGDIWIDYLGVDQILRAIDQGDPPESLRPLIVNYQGVLANPSLTYIRNAPGFRQTMELLQAYVNEAAPRATDEQAGSPPTSENESASPSSPEAPTGDSPAAKDSSPSPSSEEPPVEESPPPPAVEELPPPPPTPEDV